MFQWFLTIQASWSKLDLGTKPFLPNSHNCCHFWTLLFGLQWTQKQICLERSCLFLVLKNGHVIHKIILCSFIIVKGLWVWIVFYVLFVCGHCFVQYRPLYLSFFVGGAPASICHFFCLSISLCLLRSMSQELYIMWSLFLVHMYKMISPGGFFFFFHFLKFWFFGLLGR